MSTMFVVPGKPQGKGRPRFGNGHTYTPQSTRDYEERIAWTAKASGITPRTGPVTVIIMAEFAYPKSWPKKKRPIYHTSKPDVDNIGKIVCDALNGIAYEDDSQVSGLIVTKVYGETERLIIGLQ